MANPKANIEGARAGCGAPGCHRLLGATAVAGCSPSPPLAVHTSIWAAFWGLRGLPQEGTGRAGGCEAAGQSTCPFVPGANRRPGALPAPPDAAAPCGGTVSLAECNGGEQSVPLFLVLLAQLSLPVISREIITPQDHTYGTGAVRNIYWNMCRGRAGHEPRVCLAPCQPPLWMLSAPGHCPQGCVPRAMSPA